MNNQLTVVIPCKNEGTSIIDVISLILEQIECPIIIADSSDDKGAIRVLSDLKLKYKNIQVVSGGLPAIARNNGAKLVKTSHVLFLDADTYIYEPRLIDKCLDICLNGNYDLVTCKFKTDKKYNWLYRVFDLIQWYTSKTKPFALGGFMLFKTETFNRLKGFNEEDKIAEDYHLSSKIEPNRFRIADNFAYTPGRRFDKKGIWYMIKLAWGAWLNSNNDEWFRQDFNYWK